MNVDDQSLLESNTQYKKIMDLAVYDRETFRRDGMRAYSEYSYDDRNTAKKLYVKNLSLWQLLETWKNELIPTLAEVDKNCRKLSFQKTIARQLLVEEDKAKDIVWELLKNRRAELYHSFITQYYPLPSANQKDTVSRQRRFAAAFLQRDEEEIRMFMERYVNYFFHKLVAENHSVTIIDPQSMWLKRQKNLRALRKERKMQIMNETQRLGYIARRIIALSAEFDGLAGKIIDNDWDVATILSLRAQYEKELKNMKTEDAHPLQRLLLFESVTEDFRRTHVATTTAKISPRVSLADTKQVLNETDAILLQFFDLSNHQKNNLLTLMNEVRQLSKERQAIYAAQNRRHKVPA